MGKFTLLFFAVIFGFRFPLTAQLDIDFQKGLIAYYPFNGTTADASGNGHHGTSNGVTSTTNRFDNPNSACAFNGETNLLNLSGTKLLNTDITICGWVKVTDENTDTILKYKTPANNILILRMVNLNYQLELLIAGNKVVFPNHSGIYEIDPAHPRFDFLFVSFLDDQLTFGINNVSMSRSLTNLLVPVLFPYAIKNDPVVTVNGVLDEIRIYNRALTHDERTILYFAPPLFTSFSVNKISQTSVIVESRIITLGGGEITERGIQWDIKPQFDSLSNKIIVNPDTGVIITNITGLIPNTTYYLKAYAFNSTGLNDKNLTFTTSRDTSGATLSDIDGNKYHTVKIGTQTWMAENLKTTKYADGTPIEWGTHIYNNDPNNKLIYGLLYTWAAATNGKECTIHSEKIQGVCPDGWHIPSFGEQSALIEYLGGHAVAGGKLKEEGYEHWNEPNGGATNESGFSALGAGSYYFVNWNMVDTFLKTGTTFWNTSCEEGFEFNYAYGLGLNNQTGWAGLGQNLSSNGASVRCIKDTTLTYERVPVLSTDTILNITHDFASVKGSMIIYGSSPLLFRGVCWDTVPNPDTTDRKTVEEGDYRNFTTILTRLTPNTTYYLRMYAINTAGVGYGNELSFITKPDLIRRTVTDIEDNIYKTVRIGNQHWMAENLKTTSLNDGTPISLVPGSEWLNLSDPAYCWLKNDSTNKDIYGALYNSYAAISNKICPIGWHVPGNDEWAELKSFLGDSAGNKLKEAGYEHWMRYLDMDVTNSSGFTALPGGIRADYGGFIERLGAWWSDTLLNFWFISDASEDLYQYSYGTGASGASIRCIEDTEDSTGTGLNASPVIGDIDSNHQIQSNDASLALQYSVGLDPLPSVDPLPWEETRIATANVDNENGITAYDASLILQYEAGLITSFPAEDSKKSFLSPQADIDVSLENGFVTIRPVGELYGFNLNITGNTESFGSPEILDSGFISAVNVTPGNYSVGLASAIAPKGNDVIIKIPVNALPTQQVTVDLLINNKARQYVLGLPTNAPETSQKDVEFYPNPANTIVYFRNLSKGALVTIYDLRGKVLIKTKVMDGWIDISSLADGVYFIHIRNDANTIIRKLVKE